MRWLLSRASPPLLISSPSRPTWNLGGARDALHCVTFPECPQACASLREQAPIPPDGSNSLNFTIEQAQLSKQHFATVRRQRLHQVFNHRPHPPHDLEIVRAAVADLAEGDIDKIVPVGCPENHAGISRIDPAIRPCAVALSSRSQHAMKLIHVSTAVVGSLMAGDSAFSATSATIRNAKVGS